MLCNPNFREYKVRATLENLFFIQLTTICTCNESNALAHRMMVVQKEGWIKLRWA